MRSINSVELMGNVTRDAELRYTPGGQAIATFTVATNRTWTVGGEKREEAQFTRCVAWAKLAEICSKFVTKGKPVWVRGRLSTKQYEVAGVKRESTEVVLDDMILVGTADPDALPAEPAEIDTMALADEFLEAQRSGNYPRK